jgi:hypothetical protein
VQPDWLIQKPFAKPHSTFHEVYKTAPIASDHFVAVSAGAVDPALPVRPRGR